MHRVVLPCCCYYRNFHSGANYLWNEVHIWEYFLCLFHLGFRLLGSKRKLEKFIEYYQAATAIGTFIMGQNICEMYYTYLRNIFYVCLTLGSGSTIFLKSLFDFCFRTIFKSMVGNSFDQDFDSYNKMIQIDLSLHIFFMSNWCVKISEQQREAWQSSVYNFEIIVDFCFRTMSIPMLGWQLWPGFLFLEHNDTNWSVTMFFCQIGVWKSHRATKRSLAKLCVP